MVIHDKIIMNKSYNNRIIMKINVQQTHYVKINIIINKSSEIIYHK